MSELMIKGQVFKMRTLHDLVLMVVRLDAGLLCQGSTQTIGTLPMSLALRRRALNRSNDMQEYTMKKILIFLLCLFWCVNAWAAPPTFDARTVSTCTGCSSNSFSHTIGGGCTNDIVIVDN